jgi:hypothetical protein
MLALVVALGLAVSSQGVRLNRTAGYTINSRDGCNGRITSFRKIGDTNDNCRGVFTAAMADGWASPVSRRPFMVGGRRRRQQFKCGNDNLWADCGGGNCMKATKGSGRRWILECGNCVCTPPPPPPKVTKVVAAWQFVRQIPHEVKVSWKHGTTKTHAYTRAYKWSEAVTSTVSNELEVAAVFEGLGVGASTTRTEQRELRHSMSQAYKDEWSVNTEIEDETIFHRQYGQYLWQWTFFIYSGSDVTPTIAKSKSFAQTSRRSERPKCYPGEFIDDTYSQTCHQGYELPQA